MFISWLSKKRIAVVRTVFGSNVIVNGDEEEVKAANMLLPTASQRIHDGLM